MRHKHKRHGRLIRAIQFGTAMAIFLWPPGARAQTCERDELESTLEIGVHLGLGGGHPIVAPSPASVSAFDVAAKRQPKQMADLFQYRGLMSSYYSDRDTWNLQKLIDALEGPGSDAHLGIMFYSYGDSVLQAWLISRCGIEAYFNQPVSAKDVSRVIAELRSTLDIRARQVERAPRRRSPIPEDEEPTSSASLPEASAALTDLLFPANFRTSLKRFRHLLIVPALDIGTVPFSMLKPFGYYLVDRLSFSIAASLADAQEFLSKWRGRIDHDPSRVFEHAVVVGNPLFASDPDYVLPPLPGAEREARAVAALVKGKLFIGAEATKGTVVSATKGATFLYLATHGVADPADPLKGSFLALSGTNGRWTAYEIQNTQFRNALVILSACQTGLGKTHDAGTIGLARAFQISGADVVMSLWSIDDDATADLMTAFVKNLATEGQADALRDAMLSEREVHPDPARWASFSVFGNPW